MEKENTVAKFDSYGTLVTVASLLFVVIYASGRYDGWDMIIAVMGASFGLLYLKKKAYFDLYSLLLSVLIATTGIVVTIASVIEIASFYLAEQVIKTEPIQQKEGGISVVLLIIVLTTGAVTYLLNMKRLQQSSAQQ